jgi:hypothetical protein
MFAADRAAQALGDVLAIDFVDELVRPSSMAMEAYEACGSCRIGNRPENGHEGHAVLPTATP